MQKALTVFLEDGEQLENICATFQSAHGVDRKRFWMLTKEIKRGENALLLKDGPIGKDAVLFNDGGEYPETITDKYALKQTNPVDLQDIITALMENPADTATNQEFADWLIDFFKMRALMGGRV